MDFQVKITYSKDHANGYDIKTELVELHISKNKDTEFETVRNHFYSAKLKVFNPDLIII
jgi:hypothetical protein